MSMTREMTEAIDVLLEEMSTKPDAEHAMAVMESAYAKLMESTTYEEDVKAIKDEREDIREPMRKRYLVDYQLSLKLAVNVILLAMELEGEGDGSAGEAYFAGARDAENRLKDKKKRLTQEYRLGIDTFGFGALYAKLESDCREIWNVDCPTVGLGERIDAASALADRVIKLGKELETSDAESGSFYRMAVREAEDNKIIIEMKRRYVK